MECGGKRSATPLWVCGALGKENKSCVALGLPPHSIKDWLQ
jgi:hypothetical protein